MNKMSTLTDIARSPGDPEVLAKGPNARGPGDRLAHALGWFSIALGLTELLAARRMASVLGMEGKETLVRAYGAREIAAGVMSLSMSPRPGIAGRVVGDVLDAATLLTARSADNPRKKNLDFALAAVIGAAILDVICHQALRARHSRPRHARRDYGDRSGLPLGIEASRGLARQDVEVPSDMRATPAAG
jgi:hypothetical protein